MRKVFAYVTEFDDRKLYPNARAAREAEFDYLFARILSQVGGTVARAADGVFQQVGVDIRSGIYVSAADRLIEAAEYLKAHRDVLTGKKLDPQEEPQNG